MKKIKLIFRNIFAIILSITLIIYFITNILLSTILDKNFILKKIEETGYYDKIYGYATSNFENYIIQSGLDKSVLDGILTREDVVKDTERILNNIYSNIEESVTAESLKTKLHANIEVATQGMQITEEQKESLNRFVDEIVKDYLNMVGHLSIEKEVYNACHKFDFLIDLVKKVVLVFAGVALFGLMVTCGRRFYKLGASIGFTLFTTGLFFIILNIFVNVSVNIQAITILNDAISFVLREVLGEIFEQILGQGLLMLFGGLVLIFVSNLVHNYFKYRDIEDEEPLKAIEGKVEGGLQKEEEKEENKIKKSKKTENKKEPEIKKKEKKKDGKK